MSTHVQEPALRCPVCKAQVVVKLQVDPPTGRVTAKCPRCKAWVWVPLRYVG